MGLRCLLGHDFGPSGVVREHEEDGSEMVVTEREIRRCRRCGEEQVLSESTEVRAIRTEGEVRSERRDADAVAPASSTQGADVGDESPLNADAAASPASEGMESASTPDATGLRNTAESVTEPDESSVAAETVPDVGPELEEADDADSNTSLIERAEAGFDDADDPEEEDAVILDDATPEREHGAWPDSGDAPEPSGAVGDGGTDPTSADGAGEDAETDDDAADDSRSLAERAAEEDAELMGGSDASAPAASEQADASDSMSAASSSASGGAWPSHEDENEDEGFSADAATAGGPGLAYGNELTPTATNGQSRSHAEDDAYETSYLDNTVEQREGDGTIVSAREDDSQSPRPGVETEYYCPNCGHTRPLDSSIRTGDICPECQQGYIAERER
ncbi:hypothetical protein C2R22_01765 [Salinigranum rubrum]|uniref:Uncharacterized protein n=1 Tax=Salinigranum rubrum TaxID=755307 RepID=A0A2I8VF37_9EURY|nr:hypothetical protein [Salinigranum rubrum]AUV80542.1 hypothetical protein C2R22_01765 [Salinigranum rubrum]